VPWAYCCCPFRAHSRNLNYLIKLFYNTVKFLKIEVVERLILKIFLSFHLKCLLLQRFNKMMQ